MKINNKKIIVSTLALAMGAALAGSISGSVAWYQYSTRATASMEGVAAGTSRNLQITTTAAAAASKTHADWGWDVNLGKQDLQPVSPTVTDNVPSAFKRHSVRQYPAGKDAETTDYLKADLYFQSIDEDKLREEVTVYLETFRVNYTGSQQLDDALRIAISDGTNKFLVAKTAGDTITQGHLDLNKDGTDDRWIFEADDARWLSADGKKVSTIKPAKDADVTSYFTDEKCTVAATGTADGKTTYYVKGAAPADSATESDGDYILYGTQEKYTSTAWSALTTTFTDAYTVGTAGSFSFNTLESESEAAHLELYIWLEGWAKLGSPASSIWDSALHGEDFSLQMRFQTVAE